jgi:hypothetical protein
MGNSTNLCGAVEEVPAANPEMADRLSEYPQRDAALRLAFDEFFEPIATPPSQWLRVFGWRTWAAAVACSALLTGGLWVYADILNRSRELAGFVHDATSAYILYMKHAGSDFAVDRTQVSSELTRLLGGDSKSPNLSKFGSHVVAVPKLLDRKRLAVLFVYRNSRGQLISCYFQLAQLRDGLSAWRKSRFPSLLSPNNNPKDRLRGGRNPPGRAAAANP